MFVFGFKLCIHISANKVYIMFMSLCECLISDYQVFEYDVMLLKDMIWLFTYEALIGFGITGTQIKANKTKNKQYLFSSPQ